MARLRTMFPKFLLINFLILCCLAGCGRIEQSENEKVQEEIQSEQQDNSEDSTEQKEDSEEDAQNQEATEENNTENGQTDATSNTQYSLKGTSPVYDRSLTKGKMAVYFMTGTPVHKYASSTLDYGDSTLIVAPDGTTMLIDIGNPSMAPMIVATLDALEIDTIDYLVISHPHVDHIGGASTLLRHKTVKKVIDNTCTYENLYAYNKLMDEIEEKQIPVSSWKQGDRMSFGGIDMEVLWPKPDYPHSSTDRVGQNNGSLAMKMTYGTSTFLFSGDLHVESEAEVINKYGSKIKSDVHKMNHHGADTSSSKEWVSTVAPKLAIAERANISSDTVMGRYYKIGTTALHTGINGTIAVWTSGDGSYDVQVEIPTWYDLTLLPKNVDESGHFVIK